MDGMATSLTQRAQRLREIGQGIPDDAARADANAEALQNYRRDYDIVRRALVEIAERELEATVAGAQAVRDIARNALAACSVEYYPPGHPNASH